MSEDDKERFITEQEESTDEMNDFINARRTGYLVVNKLGSSIFRESESHQ
jgi:hypothetical protein